MKAIIVWHYYLKGRLVDYSITMFEGNELQLQQCLRSDDEGVPRNKELDWDGKKVILHQVIML